MLPVFPLPTVVLFPGVLLPLHIFEPRYREMVTDALDSDRRIAMALLQPGWQADYEGRPPIDVVGCAGRIVEYEQLPDGRYTIVLAGFTRFRVTSEDQSRPYRLARVDALPDAGGADDQFALRTSRERLVELLSVVGIELGQAPADDAEVVDTLAQYLNMNSERRQQLLEMDGPLRRARALIDMLSAQ